MCNNEQIVLLPFEFEYDGLEPDCQIVVRLGEFSRVQASISRVTDLSPRVPMMIWVRFMFRYLVGILKSDPPFGLFLADSWIKLTQLRPLTYSIAFFLKKVTRLYRSFPGRSPYRQHFRWVVWSTAAYQSFYSNSALLFKVRDKG